MSRVMSPRFVEIRHVPRENETMGAFLETFSAECYESIETGVSSVMAIVHDSASEWSVGWTMEWPEGWLIEPVRNLTLWQIPSIPTSSAVCFTMMLVCSCVYSCMWMCLSRREWRRLRRVYEN